MMEVEEFPSYGDTDMIAEDSWYDDQNEMMIQESSAAGADSVEVEMEADPEVIEYEMEEAFVEEPIMHHAPVQTFPTTPQVPTPTPTQTIFSIPPSLLPPPPPPPAVSTSLPTSPIVQLVAPQVFAEPASRTLSSKSQDSPRAEAEEVAEPSAETQKSPPVESQPSTSLAIPPPAEEPIVVVQQNESEPHQTVSQVEEVVREDLSQEQPTDPIDAPAPALQEAEAPADAPVDDNTNVVDYTRPEASPVLVTTSWESQQFYLFSYPIASSSELPPLYLSDRPELFFEPLNNLFEALRELWDSEVVSSHSELSLASDALELTLSEDNVHSRDVSLHDLNVLHIGCELEGPLTLRLDRISPRFITRYRAILSEINRVHSEVGDQEVDQEHQGNDRTVDAQNNDEEPTNVENDPSNQVTEEAIEHQNQEGSRMDPGPTELETGTVTEPQTAGHSPPSNYRPTGGDEMSQDVAEEHTELPQVVINMPSQDEDEHEALGDEREPDGVGEEHEVPDETQPDAYPSSELASEHGPVDLNSEPHDDYTDELDKETIPEAVSKKSTSIKETPAKASIDENASDIYEAPPTPSLALLKEPPKSTKSIRNVAFDLSQQDDGFVHDNFSDRYSSPLLGGETQTTRYDSQMETQQSLVFNTQDAEDISYHDDMYADDDYDQVDEFAPSLKVPKSSLPPLSIPTMEAATNDTAHEIDQPEVSVNVENTEYPEYEDAEGEYEEQVPEEPEPGFATNHDAGSTSDDQLYEHEELLPYEDDGVDGEGEAEEYEEEGNTTHQVLQGHNVADDNNDSHNHDQADDYDDVDYSADIASEGADGVAAIAPISKNKASDISSPTQRPEPVLRTVSSSQSFKRSHDESDPEGEENLFGRLAESKRAKIHE